MEDLENIVKKLAASFDSFKKVYENSTRRTFANVLGQGNGVRGAAIGQVGHGAGPGVGRGSGGGGPPTVLVDGAASLAAHAYSKGHGQGGGHLSAHHDRVRDLSPASKRNREEQDAGSGDNRNNGFTQPRRRKTKFGKSTVTLEGVDAAPVDIFVGNTNPRANAEKIKVVLILSAGQMPEKTILVINDVKCLNNLEVDPYPRTKCWKIIVPYALKIS